MRILELTQRYPPALGGVEIHVATLARRLTERGHSVTVSTTDLQRDEPFTRLPRLPDRGPIPVRRHRAVRAIPAPHGIGIVAPGMARDALIIPADVIHAHAFGLAPTWFGALARRLGRPPLVIEPHADAGRGTPGSEVYQRAVTRACLTHADRVVVQTRNEASLLARWGLPTERIELIPDGIDLEEFRGGEGPRTPGTILFVGRLYAAQKGLRPLVRAFARLRTEPRPYLRLVGEDWGGAAVVEHLARELGVRDRVILTGPLDRSALLREFSEAEVFVLPSLFEPYGIVLMEAMASGVPIVASRVGGIPEVVQDDASALLTPPGDAGALAECLDRLLTDPQERARLREGGLARVRRYDWSVVLPQWEALFENVTRSSHRNKAAG